VVQQGAEVVEVAAQTIPGIILLDILLPDVPGWEVLAALKADPRTAAIPVVIVSNIDDRLRGLALGAAEYLVKPVSRQEIQQVLNTLFAPTQPPPQKAVVVTREPDPLPDKDLPLIVLAEDNDDTSTMVTEYLSNKGYRVVVARNGAEAIEMTHEFRPALIVMDIQMPGMDGLEAIRTIRNSAEFDATPIVALTALAMPGDRERCLQAGANDYLSKPVSLRQLAAVIQELLHEGEE
jgi:CheY-like chemotaxis protein